MSILSTKENVNLLTIGLECDNIIEYQAMVAPVCMSGKRLGTLFVYRKNDVFSIDDIILTEYGTTVIGLAMQRAESEEVSEEYLKNSVEKEKGYLLQADWRIRLVLQGLLLSML